MHILFAGGGTAGHINPALAIAGYIRELHPDTRISYIGTKHKLEAKLVPEKGYNFRTIDIEGFKRSMKPAAIVHNMNVAIKTVTSSVKAKKILKELSPDLVIGTGGYVSGPVLREATKLKIPTAIHEQNAYPGITTKMLADKVDRVMLAMPEAEKYLNCKNKPTIVGNPIRQELLHADIKLARKKLGLDSRPLILSFGGSLGARPINEAVEELIKWHNGTGKYYHIHATGKSGYETMINRLKSSGVKLAKEVEVREYITDMDVCLAAADIVICRAGAITLGEIEALKKPAILIPSPYVAENHQYHNAMTLKNAGAAEVIEQKDLSGGKLIKEVDRILNDKKLLKSMQKACEEIAIVDSNERIYAVLSELTGGKI
ncbi:MAG: undecaprenyldiphospho-muramoylpentapeptide beta-N-acetylglucosaminyltransferase [Clostridia bacterium]|nr:undecaprenyldiphospho-muramoylpentapeptide beta-N-acetylglucosaminyltransferase [Clostridia bacterium]